LSSSKVLPVVVGGLGDRLAAVAADVADHHVEAAEAAAGGVDQPLGRPAGGDVEGQGLDLDAVAASLGGGRLEIVGAAGAEDEVGALGGEAERNATADAARGAGDQGDLVAELEIHAASVPEAGLPVNLRPAAAYHLTTDVVMTTLVATSRHHPTTNTTRSPAKMSETPRHEASIGDQELALLTWVGERRGATVGEAAEEYGGPRGLARSTVLTMMERLRAKGHLARRQVAGVYCYSITRPAGETMRGVVASFVEKTLGGSLSPFAAYLADAESVSPEELAELERTVARLRSRRQEDEG
jgi:predicted transcriptional regulator